MGQLLEIFRRIEQSGGSEISERSERSATATGGRSTPNAQGGTFSRFPRFPRFSRNFEALERRCPALVHAESWQQAVADAHAFLIQWGEQADRLGWTGDELFGLAPVPEKPAANYDRLSRHDCKGLIWSLRGGRVIALSEDEAAIRVANGYVLRFYRRFVKKHPAN
jgi:hypothetical protein